MTTFRTPPMTFTASVIGGVLTCLFPPVPYRRKILSIVVFCSSASPVNIYAGIVSPTGLIESNPIGANNTYNPTNPSVVQAGYPIYVSWPNAAAVDTARATMVFEGEY